MSYTKGELVTAALEEIGIASYNFDIEPEMITSGLIRLDAMMAEWVAKGVKISFPIAKKQNSASDDDSNIPDWAWEAVITNLAIRIAPSYGKAVSMETKVAAKNAYNVLLGMFSRPRVRQLPSMPRGAAYKPTDYRFTQPPKDEYLGRLDEDVDTSGVPDGM